MRMRPESASDEAMTFGGRIRRFVSLHARRVAVLWRMLAGPGRRVRLPKRSMV
jgi:hypothetical protein